MAYITSDPVLTASGSHRFGGRHSPDEKVDLHFTAGWRGSEVRITMTARSFGDTWHVGASDIHFAGYSPAISNAAQSALAAACEPLVHEWLASSARAESAHREHIREVLIAADGYDPAVSLRRAAAANAAHLTADDLRRIEALAAGLDLVAELRAAVVAGGEAVEAR